MNDYRASDHGLVLRIQRAKDKACGIKPQSVTLIGGGARSEYWRQMLADISGQQLDYRTGGDVGPALGAARLAQIAANPEKSLIELLPQLPLEQSHLP